MNQGGFSWKRLVGISAFKAKISRSIGIPLSRSGRERKIGHFVTSGGCLVIIFIIFVLAFILSRFM
jgi:hypothetical protein